VNEYSISKFVITWGSCASWGCVQAAKPNPTTAVSIDKVIKNKPIIKVPGCPPIAEVMTEGPSSTQDSS